MLPVPPARRDDVSDVLHGIEVPDPYRWLEDDEADETRAWVAVQNERTRQALVARPDRDRWHERLVALMQLPQVAGCSVEGDRLFTLDRPEGAEQFRLVVRSSVDVSVEPRVLLDPAVGSADATSAIDWYHASPDGELVAFGVSEGGTETSTLRILRAATGGLLADELPDCRAASVAWLPDGRGFWYARYPAGDEYNRAIWFHRVGTSVAEDRQLWHDEQRPETWPDVACSPDGAWVLVHAMLGWSNVEVHLHEVATGNWTAVSVGDRCDNSFAFGGDGIIGVTTLGAPRGRVVTASLDAPMASSWRTLVAERDVVLGGFTLTADEIVVVATDVAVDRVERRSLVDGELLGTIDGLGVASVGVAADRDRSGCFLTVTGFREPAAVWRWDPDSGLQRWAPVEATSSTVPELAVDYRTYPSSDGTEIGVFLIHRADQPPTAATPAILNGYGGFAITETPVWSPTIAAWCEQGGLYAIAGLRGGREHGDEWHHAGRREHKQNVFDDFHAAADWLVAQGLTSFDRLGVAGGSNGGLLVGAALTQRPRAYRAVWCAVPLLDMVRYPQFLIARLWTDEYGDPDVAEEFAWLWAYSPYHHVFEGERYPAVLLTTAEGDTRVHPGHARKMAGALQWASSAQDDQPILFHEEGKAGHGAGKPVSKRAEEAADVLAFFAWQLASGADSAP